MKFDLPLRTPRLALRALVADDLTSHQRLFSDPEVVRFLYDTTMSLEDAQRHLSGRLHATLPDEGEWLNLAVECDGQFLGEVGVSLVSRLHRQAEVGYVFGAWARGRGFATEATARMVELAFNALGAHRVVGRLGARNEPSARVRERVGMRPEALLRENEFVKGEWTDEAIYAILRDEWSARHEL
jgi:RimJ/RimL family protein N-acetyltransferase